jgi:hypothetical protein
MLLIAVVASLSLATPWTPQHQPSFEDFIVPVERIDSPASPGVSSGQAHRYRTLLRREGSKPPNFAGSYRIVIWGCGTCCNEFAIVNSRTGDVFFPSFIVACRTPIESDDVGIDFKANSRLLIITGARNEKGGGRYFYEWNGKQLKPLLMLESK